MDTFFVLCGWTDGWIGKILFKNILYFNSPSVDLSYCPSLHYTQHTQDPWPLLFWNIFFIIFCGFSLDSFKNNIYVFVSSFFLFFFTRILESMYVSRSWLSVYNSKCVCVCVWVKKCAVCPLCVLIVYVCLWFQQKCSFVLGKKKSCIFFSLGAIKLFILLIFLLSL